jgi:hypothetical protein
MEKKKMTAEDYNKILKQLKRFEKMCDDILAILKRPDEEEKANSPESTEAERINDAINALSNIMDLFKKEEKHEKVIRDSE